MTFRRVIGFGDALHLEALSAEGGLNAAVDRIHAVVGVSIGTRNTFAKLFKLVEPPVGMRERERAWLLLVALGQDPEEWDMGDFEPPVSWDMEAIRDSRARGAWYSRPGV